MTVFRTNGHFCLPFFRSEKRKYSLRSSPSSWPCSQSSALQLDFKGWFGRCFSTLVTAVVCTKKKKKGQNSTVAYKISRSEPVETHCSCTFFSASQQVVATTLSNKAGVEKTQACPTDLTFFNPPNPAVGDQNSQILSGGLWPAHSGEKTTPTGKDWAERCQNGETFNSSEGLSYSLSCLRSCFDIVLTRIYY